MSLSIPIGEIFEAFINWLTDSFSVIFDAISAVLNFAIEALENILLLDHSQVYPGIILVLLGGYLTYFLFARIKPQFKVVGAAAVAILIGGAEIWRYTELEYKVDSDRGAALASEIEVLEAAIESAAPGDYEAGIQTLQGILSGQDLDDAAARQIDRAMGDLEDLRPNRFDDAEDELLDIQEDALDGDFALSRDNMNTLQEAVLFYRALSLSEDLERLGDDLRELDEPDLRTGFLNQRAYDRFSARLAALEQTEASWAQEAGIQDALGPVKGIVKDFDPNRLSWYPWFVLIVLFIILALVSAGRGLAIFTGVGFLLIVSMGFWEATMESLALVLSATIFALLIGIPVGISAARNNVVDNISRPILDFMQTMPAFVYLIPAVLFFGLGKVPGAMATLIFAMPPAVRLTSLGIRQVPTEVVEACLAFGSTPRQLLYKAQLPIARPTILAGLNQTIMLALSMVVIGGMIGAGGLGQEVLSGITQLKIGLGFESGISVVILAIFLDRVTQSFGSGAK
jgi:glycine betaine/proline transport system permease protein